MGARYLKTISHFAVKLNAAEGFDQLEAKNFCMPRVQVPKNLEASEHII